MSVWSVISSAEGTATDVTSAPRPEAARRGRGGHVDWATEAAGPSAPWHGPRRGLISASTCGESWPGILDAMGSPLIACTWTGSGGAATVLPDGCADVVWSAGR